MKKVNIAIIFFIIYICFLCSNPWTLDMTKYKVYSYIEEEFKLKTILCEYNQIKSLENFPVILKPNMYSRHSTGIFKIENKTELKNIENKLVSKQNYIVQEFYKSKYEVGVLYEKNPLCKKGKIISIVLKQKYNNYWEPLQCGNIIIKQNPCYLIDRPDLITKELNETIERISSNIPKFYVGRYDIGFDDIEDFKKGKNFKIFELNGNGSIDLRNVVTDLKLDNFYKLIYFLRFIIVRIIFGFINLIINKHECAKIFFETTERTKMLLNANEISWIISPSFA